MLRSFLFSKWFFGLIFFVSMFDLAADVFARVHLHEWRLTNAISIGLSVLLAVLAGWMFVDLHTRRPS